MSLRSYLAYRVPEETARVAQAAYPRGNLYMRLHAALGTVYQDHEFAALFPTTGQRGIAPVRLALVTLMQFAEGLSNRQAAEAVRGRIDWKYLLCLELTDPGFDHTALSEFRSRLVAGSAEQQLLEGLLEHCREAGWLKARGRQRTDSTHVLAAIRVLNRLKRVGETMHHALNSLAVVVPDWLRQQVPAAWFDRYSTRIDNYHLPKADHEREQLAATIGEDGFRLLEMVETTTAVPWLRDVPALQTLRQVWQQQYTPPPDLVRWREVSDLIPTAEQIASPHDPEARWSTKRSVSWVGYKVHLTESCDPNLPHLITHVETTVATTSDEGMAETIHAALAQKELLPAEHLLDRGYVDADTVLDSRLQYDIELVGPLPADPSWQVRAGQVFDVAAFSIDWEVRQATCPQGQLSTKWQPKTTPDGTTVIHVRFARATCAACSCRLKCTRGAVEPRGLTIRPRDQHLILQEGRKYQTTEAFKQQYAARAGIEGTISQGLRRCDLRQSRYIGLKKTHLQQLLTATALNLVRIGEWLAETPRAKTRCSPFAALKLPAA